MHYMIYAHMYTYEHTVHNTRTYIHSDRTPLYSTDLQWGLMIGIIAKSVFIKFYFIYFLFYIYCIYF